MLPRPVVLKTLASTGAFDEKSWIVFDRVLVNAGMIARRRRGAGAEPLGAAEIAALILAGFGTDSPSMAASVMPLYRDLPGRARGPLDLEVAGLEEALVQPTLGGAVESLIANSVAITTGLEARRDVLLNKLNPPEFALDHVRELVAGYHLLVLRDWQSCTLRYEELRKLALKDDVIDYKNSRYIYVENLWGHDEVASMQGWSTTIRVDARFFARFAAAIRQEAAR